MHLLNQFGRCTRIPAVILNPNYSPGLILEVYTQKTNSSNTRETTLQSNTFSKKKKHGGIQKIAREHYLGDDIYCGSSNCKSCDSSTAKLSSSASTILVLDTNVVLNQIDLLENPEIDDVFVLSIVLNEVKNKNLSVHNRLRALTDNPLRRFFVFSNEHHKDTYVKAMVGESPNDRNNRAIRVATEWYKRHLGGSKRVLLITNDKEN